MNHTSTGEIGSRRSTSDSDVLTAVAKMLETRAKLMGEALDEKFPHDGPGRAWHAGYVVAMRDTLRLIERRPHEWPTEIEGVGRPDY